MDLKNHPAYAALEQHHKTRGTFHLRQALQDQARCGALTVSFGQAIFDFSKHLVTADTMNLLQELAVARDVAGWRHKMFTGEKINNTENRAVLHTALRAAENADIRADGQNVVPGVYETRKKMAAFADKIRSDKNITDVVSIGIGGSDLGPRFVTEALVDLHDGPAVHFVSNVDGHAISRTLAALKPENTLAVVASKTFTTEETMINAGVARQWLAGALGEDKVGPHLAALSVAVDKAVAFGVPQDHIFGFADWVGGRYSLWSAIGMPIMLATGPQNFDRLLAGARAMDDHFRTAPADKNVPLLMESVPILTHPSMTSSPVVLSAMRFVAGAP